jgi:DNA-binding response OmpR family regulator
MKVLLCSDDKNTLEDVGLIFKIAFPDCSLIITDSKKQCISFIHQSPDFFIVSINKIDGTFDFDFIKEIRNLSSNPIVIISTIFDCPENMNDMELLKAMRSGADLYMNKPVNNIVSIAKLRSLINRETGRTKEDGSL